MSEENKSNNQQRSTLWIAAISAVIGGLLVGLILAPIFLLSKSSSVRDNQLATSQLTNQVQTTSVKVNSNITKAVENNRSTVVGVINLSQNKNELNGQETQQGYGSGIVIRKTGQKAYVVTNNHVIAGGSKIQVKLSDGKKTHVVDAKVLGSDETTDLAVLEIDGTHVKKVATIGNSNTLQSGETTIAIGNPLGLDSTVTVGVVSSPKRTIQVSESNSMEVIQTDAAINSGNSGGSLINVAGHVIGINSLKIAENGVEGLSFAIPIQQALPIIEQLIQHGSVPRPYLGVSLIDLKSLQPTLWTEGLQLPQSVKTGVVVQSISANTPASQVLQSKDVIVKIDNQTIDTASALKNYLYTKKTVGASIKISFYRTGTLHTAHVKLIETPDQ